MRRRARTTTGASSGRWIRAGRAARSAGRGRLAGTAASRGRRIAINRRGAHATLIRKWRSGAPCRKAPTLLKKFTLVARDNVDPTDSELARREDSWSPVAMSSPPDEAIALFEHKGGSANEPFPCIHVPPACTSKGTPYLQAPGVVTLAKPQVQYDGLRGFLDGFSPELSFGDYLSDPLALTPATSLCKVAGQTCYLSFGPKRSKNADAGKYLENIKASGHGSVLEHASFSFLLYGVSRSFTHELVRHRAGTAFSQTSQRYVDGKVLRFVERPEYRHSPELHRRFEEGIDRAASEYAERADFLLNEQAAGAAALSGEARTDARKKVQQAARSALPNETEAPIVFSANVRSLRHIIEMRASRHAEPEIREVFVRIYLCLVQIEPLLFSDYSLLALPDGTHELTTAHRKV